MTSASRLVPGAVMAFALLGLAAWLGLRQPDAAAAYTHAAPVAPPLSRVFMTDADGHLVVDQRTRLALEVLVAQATPERAPASIEPELRRLPPEAAAEARDLLRAYLAYEAATRARQPGPHGPGSAEQLLAELSALSSLRLTHFGSDRARDLFGEEEALSRRLLEQGRDGQARTR